MCTWGSEKFYRTWGSFINIGSFFFFFLFLSIYDFNPFLFLRNKDKLIKLVVFLK